MPETGNKTNSSKKILSIRLWRGGFSFYIASDAHRSAVALTRVVTDCCTVASVMEDAMAEFALKSGLSDYDAVQVFVDTADTIFVPAELMDGADISELLESAGIVISSDKVIVVTDSVEGISAAAVFDSEPIELLQVLFKGRLRFFSPVHELLAAGRMLTKRKDVMTLYPTSENIYMVQYDENSSIVLAEVYPCCGEADAIYYCSELISPQRAPKIRLCIYGERAPRYVSAVKKYFRKTDILRLK